jgi:spore germination protein PE
MLRRISNVDRFEVMIVSFSSIIQVGDSRIVNAFSRAMAIQRETEFFYGNEGNFPSYSVFKRPIPFQPITEPISVQTYNMSPVIKVKNIDIIGISSSSILHIGSSCNVSMEARVKHIRQLEPYGH